MEGTVSVGIATVLLPAHATGRSWKPARRLAADVAMNLTNFDGESLKASISRATGWTSAIIEDELRANILAQAPVP